MINDERIYLVKGRVRKNCLIIVIITALLWIIAKAIAIKTVNFSYYGFELSILFSASTLLLGSLFVSSEVKDEFYHKRKCDYYNLVFSPFIIFICFSYAIFVAFDFSSGFYGINYLASFLIYTLTLYTFCYLKHHNIYFHNKSIETNHFYKHVGINCLIIICIFLMMFIVSAISLSVLGIHDLLLIFIPYFISCIGLIIEYLFFSSLEKIFYSSKTVKRISNAGVIAYIVSLVLLVVSGLCNYLVFINLMNFDFNVARLNILGRLIKVLSMLVKIIAVVYIYYDLKEDNKTPKILKTIYYTIVANSLLTFVYSLGINIYITNAQNALINISRIVSWFTSISSIISIVNFVLIFICFYVNDYKYKLLFIIATANVAYLILMSSINSTEGYNIISFINLIIQSIISCIVILRNNYRIDLIEEE